jgi:tRNA-splicing ligase RtcB (3'-phosphate/5'-hydroxy nucleic acid ligase)
MSDTNPTQIHATGEATGFIPAPGDKGKPITVIGTNSIRAGFDATCAGRCMGRKAADRALDQKTVDDEFVAHDILSNCRLYPKDEAPAAYKDFDAVLDSVKAAGLAEVARLKARFIIKDSDTSLDRAA